MIFNPFDKGSVSLSVAGGSVVITLGVRRRISLEFTKISS